ncbi:NAD-dependent epimerase/dehydratase family protein [Bacillus pseudomycoides]|uniref:NAD-dependent epimerase/dehydratase family protein n=1 Tax=Bacillus pseudomycoides TaxID=64104 RepID=UPI000BF6F6F1|nr:NAD-dependent epimerase/dehydratase family protein [Bacillus pseudomycoides]PGD73699.1 hypothetical protein COM46_21715 [Bacillus pseudomycoides]
MKTIVTGGSGFIGSHLVNKLVELGHNVHVIDKVKPLNSNVFWIDVDINNINELEGVFEDVQYVFHLAAVADATKVNQNPRDAIQTSYIGTSNILEACKGKNIERIIYASTIWVYSDTDKDVITESDIVAPPQNLYSSLKYTGELIIQNLCSLYNIPYTILRYGIPYGTGMRENLAIPSMVRKAILDNEIMIHGSGKQTRNFIHVNDLIEGHIAALKDSGKNQIFNLEGIEYISIKDLAQTIVNQLKNNCKIVHTPAREVDYKGKNISIEKANSLLNWEPKMRLDLGLEETVEYYQNYFTNYTQSLLI